MLKGQLKNKTLNKIKHTGIRKWNFLHIRKSNKSEKYTAF